MTIEDSQNYQTSTMKLIQEKKEKEQKIENVKKKKETQEAAKKEQAKKEAQAKVKNFLQVNPVKSKAPSVAPPLSKKGRDMYSENLSAMQKRVTNRPGISAIGSTASKELSYYQRLAAEGSPNKIDNNSQFKESEVNSIQENSADGQNDSIVEES